MPEDILNEESAARGVPADAGAFAIAHAIVDLLKRIFFTWLPFLVCWQWIGLDWMASLGCGLVMGHGLEAVAKRALEAGDREDR